jgi:serine/threonine protein kinase
VDGAGLVPGTEAGAGLRLIAGRYRLAAELGRGGMGVVWLADDQLVGRRVAVKELRPPQGLAQDGQQTYRQRALQEARSAARIHHPGAVTLYDVLPASDGDDAVYLIMELVAGPTLAQVISQHGRLAEPTVAAFGLQLLDVLDAAHTLGVVHRDIKPANILITPGGQAKLTDFGIAHTMGDLRLTRSGILGTQAYLAPELFESAPITPAADVWSLGATLYAAAEGRSPFERDTTGATLRAILIDELPPPRCSPALATALTTMLQRDPAHRATISQARATLHTATTTAPATTTTYPASTTTGPATTTTAPRTPPPPGADGRPLASHPQPQPPWAQLPTRRSAAPPPVPPPPHHAPQPPQHTPQLRQPGQSRRTAVIAAVLLAAAITGGILATGHHHTPAPKPVAIHSLIATLTDPGGDQVSALAFSPDGQTLAAGDRNDSAYLWNTTNHSVIATLTDPGGSANVSDSVNSVAFSPDGQTLATADGNGSTYLWNTATHTITATLTDPKSQGVSSVAFSPNGKTLAVADMNGSTYLWSTASHRITATLTDLDGGGVNSVAFSPDGQTLASADDYGSTYLWSIATQSVIATLTDPNGNYVNSVAFSPDGKTLITTDGKGVIGYLWNAATRSVIATVHDPGGYEEKDATFSPDGKSLATGDGDGSTCLWQVPRGG